MHTSPRTAGYVARATLVLVAFLIALPTVHAAPQKKPAAKPAPPRQLAWPLPPDAPRGTYQVEVGCYLLATLRRLSVLDAVGRPSDDKVIIGEFSVP